MSDICPFCGRDPFHYVDNGIGMEAVAVTCCELGDTFYRGMRPAPEEVTMIWEEFQEVGAKLAEFRSAIREVAEYWGASNDDAEPCREIARNALSQKD